MGDQRDATKQADVYRDALNKEKSVLFKSLADQGGFCMNEHDTWARSLSSTHGVALRQDGVPSCYRCPMPGEPVTVSGMCRRSDLNGARGEIVDSNMDERGRIIVRIFNSSVDADSGSRRMKILCKKLVPARSSLPHLTSTRPPLHDECSSVRSLSHAGSMVSVSTRRRGSARGSDTAGSEHGTVQLPRVVSPTTMLGRKSESESFLGRGEILRGARLRGMLDRAQCQGRALSTSVIDPNMGRPLKHLSATLQV